MPGIDLHTHSTASDGTLSPAELVCRGADLRLEAMALTDHDTIAGNHEAMQEALRQKELAEQQQRPVMEFIPGCELTVQLPERTVDLVALWVPTGDCELAERLQWIIDQRNCRNEQIVAKLQQHGVDICMDDVLATAQGTVGRPHIARALMQKGYVQTMQLAFDKYIGGRGMAYVPKTVLSPEQGIAMLKQAGATVFLAHPVIYKYNDNELEVLLRELKEYGLDGVEAYYTEHSLNRATVYRKMAKRLDMVVCGGSDFHGANKPAIELGIGRGQLFVPVIVLDALKEYRAAQGLWT